VACGFKEQKLYKQPTTEELQRVILKHKNWIKFTCVCIGSLSHAKASIILILQWNYIQIEMWHVFYLGSIFTLA
jgi:hypothetical protein